MHNFESNQANFNFRLLAIHEAGEVCCIPLKDQKATDSCSKTKNNPSQSSDQPAKVNLQQIDERTTFTFTVQRLLKHRLTCPKTSTLVLKPKCCM